MAAPDPPGRKPAVLEAGGQDAALITGIPEESAETVEKSAASSSLTYARLLAVLIRATPEGRAVDASTPLALFPTRLARGQNISLTGYASRALYAVARDGRFLMNVNLDVAPADIPPLTVVLNWDAGLKK